jgi:DnaK suppressor protein
MATKTVKKKTTRKKKSTSTSNIGKTAKKKIAMKKVTTKKTATKAVPPKKTTKKAVMKTVVKKVPRKKIAKKKVSAKPGPGEKVAKKVVKKKTAKKKIVRKKAVKKKVRVRRRRRNPKQFAKIRDLLVQKKALLTAAYAASKGASMVSNTDGTEDYIDYAVSSYAKEFMLSLSEIDRKQILKVEEAITRIDRGQYGLCGHCGQDISIKRLEVAPWAGHCIRCQEMEERGLLSGVPMVDYEDDIEEFDEEQEKEVQTKSGKGTDAIEPEVNEDD